ncbi:MAG: alanine--tRNA ligase-related protein [Candidatus Kariarchaeaceae archaeon]|jgi:alanyl-tRNA synthetase
MGGDHSNSIDASILDMKRYWEMPDTYQFQSEIKEVEKEGLVLKYNLFYPEGGGQPADQGYLTFDGNQVQVVDVQEVNDTVWLRTPTHSLEEGMVIEGFIDQNRRESLTRNHSAQHLLSAVFWEEFEYETSRALMDIELTEIEFDKNLDFEILTKGLLKANEYISENLDISSQVIDSSNMKELHYRGDLPKGHQFYRIVKIGSIDLNACGGTHLRRTADIGSIALEKIDGKRVKFSTGDVARNMHTRSMTNLMEISRVLGMPLSEVKPEVKRLMDQNVKLHKDVLQLEQTKLRLELNNPRVEIIERFELQSVGVDTLERGMIVDSFKGDKNSVLLVTNNTDGFVLISGSEELTSKIMSDLRSQGVQGGGRGTTVMGKTGGVDIVMSLRSILKGL